MLGRIWLAVFLLSWAGCGRAGWITRGVERKGIGICNIGFRGAFGGLLLYCRAQDALIAICIL